jgi:hypothetical protein
MRGLRRILMSWLFDATVRSAPNTMGRSEMQDRAKDLSFETDTGKLGVRWTGLLRERLRRTWLKLRRG